MASASSKKSLDTDYITLRKVFAKLSDNSQVPANYVLTSVGESQTYWSNPSTLGALPTFNEVQMDSNQYIATNAMRSFQLREGVGIGLSTVVSSTTSNLQILNRSFQRIDVSGVSSIYAFSNFVLNNTIDLATSGFLSTSTKPPQNLIVFHSLIEAPALSTNILSFQSLKVISSMNAVIDTSPFGGNMIFRKTDHSTFPILAGVKDFVFQTNFSPAQVTLQLSSYTAKDFLQVSTQIATSFVSTISTVNSLFTSKDIFSTALTSLSTTEYKNYSTNVSTTFGVSNYTQDTYNQKFGDTLARVTLIQFNDDFGTLYTGLSTISSVKSPVYLLTSTTKGFIDQYSTPTSLSTSTFLNFQAGSIFNFTVNGIFAVSTQLSTLSTAIGSNINRYVVAFPLELQGYVVSTNSTIANLGTIGYISTPSLQSSIQGLGELSYISTPALISSFSNLSSILPTYPQIASSLTSTTKGLFDNTAIISTLSLQSSIVSTTKGLFDYLGNTYVSSTGLRDSIVSTTSGINGYAGSQGYISSLSLVSTFQSTIEGLGMAGYPRMSSILSSINSTIYNISYLSSQSLLSTVDGISTLDYTTLDQLTSSVNYFETYTKSFLSCLVLPPTLFQQTVPMHLHSAGPTMDTLPSSNFYFSSVRYASLGGFDGLMSNAKFVTIEYSPAIKFDSWTIQQVDFLPQNVFPILSTGIQISSLYYSNTNYVQQVPFPCIKRAYDNAGPDNLYSKKILFQLDKNDFLRAKDHGFSISHYIQLPYYDDGYGNIVYPIDPSAGIYTPLSNSLFVSIYN